MLGRLKGSRDLNYLMLPLDLQEVVNLRDERHQLISVLFVRGKFAQFHPFLFLLANHRAPNRKDVGL